MRSLGLSILLALAISLPAMAQADTLMLSQIGIIQTPAAITGLYAVDLQGDSAKELISSSANNVNVYDSQSGELLWTSPEVFNPGDFSFHDLDSDNHPDIAFRDSINVFIFSGLDFDLLWESPLIERQCFCYTVGDRNADGHNDIAMVIKLRYSGGYDSIMVNYYDGPDYLFSGGRIILMRQYHSNGNYDVETPIEILIARLNGGNGFQQRIILFSSRESFDSGSEWYNLRHGGAAYYFFPDTIKAKYFGELLSRHIITHESDTSFYGISDSWSCYYDPGGGACGRHRYAAQFGADSIISSQIIWEFGGSGGDWRGYQIGEISSISDGNEIFYCTNTNTMTLKSFPDLSLLWTVDINVIAIGIYNSSFFNEPKVLIGNPYKLFSGSAGALSAVFINQGINLSEVIDLNNDGEDELLSYTGNTLHIYHAVMSSVGLEGNPDFLPAAFRLHPAYPNPFNFTTIIKYDLPKSADVRIEIFDILGRKVATLTEAREEAGSHEVIWDGSSITSGIYFYRLKAGEFSEIKKMAHLK